jgi:hypothetical protein
MITSAQSALRILTKSTLYFLSRQAKRHLAVDYNIEPLELLISILHVSLTQEHLSPSRIVSFVCFLKRHLKATKSDIERCIRGEIIPAAVPAGHLLLLPATARGVVESRRVHPQIEDYLNRLRPSIPSLSQYRSIELEEDANLVHTMGGGGARVRLVFKQTATAANDSGDDLSDRNICATDQCAFSFE